MVMTWVTIAIVFLGVGAYLGWVVSGLLTFLYERYIVRVNSKNNKKE